LYTKNERLKTCHIFAIFNAKSVVCSRIIVCVLLDTRKMNSTIWRSIYPVSAYCFCSCAISRIQCRKSMRWRAARIDKAFFCEAKQFSLSIYSSESAISKETLELKLLKAKFIREMFKLFYVHISVSFSCITLIFTQWYPISKTPAYSIGSHVILPSSLKPHDEMIMNPLIWSPAGKQPQRLEAPNTKCGARDVPKVYKVAFTGIRFKQDGGCAKPRLVARINTSRPETLPHSQWAITRTIIVERGGGTVSFTRLLIPRVAVRI
jgi:hypothetical protein